MELQLALKGFDVVRKRKKWIFMLCAIAFTGYGAYKVYHAPSVARKRKKLSKLLGAFISVAEAVSGSAETIGVISTDMKEFLLSDSDQVPSSVKQISKITRSDEFSDSLISFTQAVTVGALRGYQSMNQTDRDQSTADSNFVDRVVDKLFSPAGSGFASVVVGSFARNLVLALYPDGHSGGESNSSNSTRVRHLGSNEDPGPTWVDVVCGDKCGELIGNCVQLFVSTAVAVYLDKTMDINTYDDFFSGLTNPKHGTKVKDMLVSVCNNAIETLVKTSHQVLSGPDVNSSPTSYLRIEESPTPARIKDLGEETPSLELRGENISGEGKESGWVGKVSSTLAVPSNRRLVLDMTGRVTFETVRSFMEFLLETFSAGLKRCADIAHEAAIELVKYVAAKSSVIMTICFSLCLHIMGGSWALIPA